MKFYSRASRGFYSPEINGAAMPADVVQVSDDEHLQLLLAQMTGMAIVPGAGGFPVARERVPSKEDLAAEAFAERDRRMAEARDVVEALEDDRDDEAAVAPWRAYRKALRVIQDQPDFPERIDWPARP